MANLSAQKASVSTNVPQIQWTPTGLVVPSEAAVLAGVLADLNAAFGGNLNITNLQTPQGQLASSMAAAISNCYALFTQFVNGVDPALNESFMQDAIGFIYFLNRSPPTSTIVGATCTGSGGVIPTGSPSSPQAQDAAGNLYYCTLGTTLPSGGGSASLQFANVATGPIPFTGPLSIYQTVPGWDQITSPALVSLGVNVESAESFEYQREQTVAANSQGAGPAVYGAVFEVPGVTDVFYYENNTNGTVHVGTTAYALVANSIFCGVIGGAYAAVAEAIYTKKSPGCNMNGNTTQTVSDPSGYSPPVPTYTITFNDNTQNPASVYFAISVKNLSSLPANIASLIQQAVVAQFTGAVGSPRARIGALLVALNYAAAVQGAAGPSIVVPVLSIGIGTNFSGTATLVSASTTLTVASVVSGQLTFGTALTGTNIPAGAYIVQQLTGTPGGVGTYQMSIGASGTVGSAEAITGAPGPSAQFGIDQGPTISSSNVVVTLV